MKVAVYDSEDLSKKKTKSQNRTWGRNCTLPNENLQWLVLILVGHEQSLGLSPFGWAGFKPHLEISRISEKCFKCVSPEQNKSIKPSQIPLDEIFQTHWERLCSLGPDVMKLWSETLIPGGNDGQLFCSLVFLLLKRYSSEVCEKKGKCLKASMPFCSLSLHQRGGAGKERKKRKICKFCFYLGNSISVPHPQLV